MKRYLIALGVILTACGIGGQTMPERTPRSLWRIEVFDQLGNSRGVLSDVAAIKNITASLKPDYTCDTMSFEANADKLSPAIRPLDLVQLSTNDASFIATNGGTQFAPVFYGEVITPGTPFSFTSNRFTVRNLAARLSKISPPSSVLSYPSNSVEAVTRNVADDLPTQIGLFDSGTSASVITYSSTYVTGSAGLVGAVSVNARSYGAIFDELIKLSPGFKWGVRPDKILQTSLIASTSTALSETSVTNPARIAWKSPDASGAVNTVHWLLEIRGSSSFFRYTSSIRAATEGEQSISLAVPEGLNLLSVLPTTITSLSRGLDLGFPGTTGSRSSFDGAGTVAFNTFFVQDTNPATNINIYSDINDGTYSPTTVTVTATATSGTPKFYFVDATNIFGSTPGPFSFWSIMSGSSITLTNSMTLGVIGLQVRSLLIYAYDTATLDTLAQGYYRPAGADAASVTVDGILEPTKTIELTLGSGLVLSRPAALYTYNWDVDGYATTTIELGDAYNADDATLVNLIAARDSAAQLNAQIFSGKVR